MNARWLMPDPLGGDITNPQSLNRYAYALNNPTTNTDPSGLKNILGYNLGGGGGWGSLLDVYASLWAEGPFGDGACNVDALSTPCGLAGSIVQSGAGVQCPHNACSIVGADPYNGKQAFLQFTASAGAGASGYLSMYDWSQGVNDANGTFLSNAAYQVYLRGNFLDAINAQLGAAIDALEAKGVAQKYITAFEDYESQNFSSIYVEGGNANFSSFDPAGSYSFNFSCPSGRCNLGALGALDFSHNSGSTFHLDTADPFNFPLGTLEHFGVDVILGNMGNSVIPR